ncbi:hypothetical protein ALC60_01614 [Trachymyrmex zeteki]|uniref:Uncharacterized protein n=1 Tax=Mycetomoellerius zeteki TaxID=64791 RepID=A0A151XG59_9HYME|nr:hypothetical protein ALC60_01614 [Trachymyrmex zeteki]
MGDARTGVCQTPGKRFPRPNALRRGRDLEDSLGRTNRQIPIFMVRETLSHRCCTSIARVWKRKSHETQRAMMKKKRNSIRMTTSVS